MKNKENEVKILLDGNGGDNAPFEVVKGAIDAVNKSFNIKIIITGDKNEIKGILDELNYTGSSIEIKHTTEKIEMAEHPVFAIKKKKDSSMVIGMKMLANDEADAFVSAGNTGAVLVGGQVIVGRLKGVKNTPLASVLPSSKNNQVMLLDCGARVDVDENALAQYAILASIYMNTFYDIKNPKVGILNIGAEEEKGNALVQKTIPLLKENKEVNFIGSVEARDVLKCDADIVIAEGFSGNVALKSLEGTSKLFLNLIKQALKKNLKTKLGALLLIGPLKKELSKYDIKSYGGACLLGCKKVVLKTHGSSKFNEISNTILQAEKLVQNNFIERLTQNISN